MNNMNMNDQGSTANARGMNNDANNHGNIINAGAASSSGGGGTGATISAGTATTTATMVFTQQQQPATTDEPVLRLSLRPRNNVTWDEAVVNNEGLGRKSSKRCCIFHKARAFGESSTESSDDGSGDDGSASSSSGGGGSGNAKPIARKKNGTKKIGGIGNKPKVPDYQRFHA